MVGVDRGQLNRRSVPQSCGTRVPKAAARSTHAVRKTDDQFRPLAGVTQRERADDRDPLARRGDKGSTRHAAITEPPIEQHLVPSPVRTLTEKPAVRVPVSVPVDRLGHELNTNACVELRRPRERHILRTAELGRRLPCSNSSRRTPMLTPEASMKSRSTLLPVPARGRRRRPAPTADSS